MYGIVWFKEEEEVKEQILERIQAEGIDSKLYAEIEANTQPLDLKPDFLLDDLPERINGQDQKEMLLIPEGTAFVGEGEIEEYTVDYILDHIDEFIAKASPENDEPAKATEIYLYPFYMDKTPVSNLEYKQFCEAAKHPTPTHWKDGQFHENAADLPVVNISIEDAQAYAQWTGKELPTEVEWEKACRGAKGCLYSWGDEWDAARVKNKSGEVGKQFDREFEELNSTYHEGYGMVRFKKHRFTLPPHPNTQFDEEEFLTFLEGSISFTVEEKQKVVDAIPKLSQAQIEELLRILHEEKEKFSKLDKKHEAQLMALSKQHYTDLMMPELHKMYLKSMRKPGDNSSPYGVADMVGTVYEMTCTELNKQFVLKGGSWFDGNPQESCKAYSRQFISPRQKRMDVGFRCVKPIFCREDAEKL